MVAFCGTNLWKKSLLQLSCDFDFETNARHYFERKERHLDETYETRRKGGTMCMMESPSQKWRLESTIKIPKTSAAFSNAYQVPRNRVPHVRYSVVTFSTNHYLIFRPSSGRKQRARLFTPFFSNVRKGLCVSFRYLIRGSVTPKSGLLVFLLPCNSPYRIPVMNIADNTTAIWRRSVVPLPDYQRPYRLLFEAKSRDKHLEFVALDDIVLSPCGESTARIAASSGSPCNLSWAL